MNGDKEVSKIGRLHHSVLICSNGRVRNKKVSPQAGKNEQYQNATTSLVLKRKALSLYSQVHIPRSAIKRPEWSTTGCTECACWLHKSAGDITDRSSSGCGRIYYSDINIPFLKKCDR